MVAEAEVWMFSFDAVSLRRSILRRSKRSRKSLRIRYPKTPRPLNWFFPEKATSLAVDVLDELVKEVEIRPLPIVFASFSGGPKGCMYKVLQIIQGNCEAQIDLEKYKLIRDCISGLIYDSSPVDFTSDLGTKFVHHPTVLKMSEPPRLLSWLARGFASGLDALFLTWFEAQRAEYWQTLYSSVVSYA